MHQFDSPKKKKKSAFDKLNALANELESDLDDSDDSDDVSDAEEIEEGVFDDQEGMTHAEIKELERSVKPVQHVLVKVHFGLILFGT